MKRYFFLLVGFFLIGCDMTQITGEKLISEKFKVSGTIFQYGLPESWVKLETHPKKGEIVLAQKKDENFVIIQRYSDSNDLASEIFQQAQNNFFFFKSIRFSKQDWVFQGKPSSTAPLREFHQKIYPIKEANIFLYASCSYEYSEEKSSDCERILKSWEILVDKK